MGAGQVGGFTCTQFAVAGRSDMPFNVMPLSVDKPGAPLHSYSGFTASASQCRAVSRERLQIQSTDPRQAPKIETNYLSETSDCNTLAAGIALLREFYSQAAFRDLIDAEVLPCEANTSQVNLIRFAQTAGGTVFHPIDACRMGSDENSVVDATLKVRGVERLRVIDASVMPEIISANTNAESIMIGEKDAALVLGLL